MKEWQRHKAVRRFTWLAIGLCLFPGAFFVWAMDLVQGPVPEATISLFPALLAGALAAALHYFRPARFPAMDHWKPEDELLGPTPRKVEPRWSTPLVCLPILLWLFPIFFLVLVVTGVRTLDWGALALISLLPAFATGYVIARLQGRERWLLKHGEVAPGKVRRILTDSGFFRMKVEYEIDGEQFFHWTANLANRTWFGPLLVEERKFVTLLVHPGRPEEFVVYPFCSHEVPGALSGWVRRIL